MKVYIESVNAKKIVGLKIRMTLSDNKTVHLWKTFMPLLYGVKARVNASLLAVQEYAAKLDFASFSADDEFEMWAGVEVLSFDEQPEELETLVLASGQYATFLYRGKPEGMQFAYRNFFENWLPGSGYALDARPHFQVMGEKYKKDDPDSEEEVWIPIRVV